MLQQTQVDRVIPKYTAWLKMFPTWTTLAHATTRDLLTQWAGLGYNRRALFARDAARMVVRDGVPHTKDEWRRLKGVGPYMAAALAEFADHERSIVIDTNVRRVAGRALLGIAYPRTTDDRMIVRSLDRVIPKRSSHWEAPQAFMDLASSICLARVPSCDICPLNHSCLSRKKFSPDRAERTVSNKRSVKKTERRHAEKPHPDRIYRGRILAWIRMHGPTTLSSVGHHVDPAYDPIEDEAWIRAMAARLVKDGLLTYGSRDTILLPHS